MNSEDSFVSRREILSGAGAFSIVAPSAVPFDEHSPVPEALDETGIAGQHDAQQRLRVEARSGQQAQLAQGGRTHLLRFIDEQHAAPAGGVQVR